MGIVFEPQVAEPRHRPRVVAELVQDLEADPTLLGKTQSVWVPAKSNIDLLAKGKFDLAEPELTRGVSDLQQRRGQHVVVADPGGGVAQQRQRLAPLARQGQPARAQHHAARIVGHSGDQAVAQRDNFGEVPPVECLHTLDQQGIGLRRLHQQDPVGGIAGFAWIARKHPELCHAEQRFGIVGVDRQS
ncbi:MAG: hypothetical protein B7Z08_00235 [Sphingomonadales bacterium 32-68-7]|nr:MAG: hypothetical protein B7Z08_00235 [Sphingomonadales bacterium 32-68-7]